LECKKKGLPSPLVQAQQKRQQPQPFGHHNKGVPAEYKPSNRGGAYHRDFYSASQTPPANTDRRNASPNGRSPNSSERYSSPRHRFASPEFNSPGQRPHFSPRWDTPRWVPILWCYSWDYSICHVCQLTKTHPFVSSYFGTEISYLFLLYVLFSIILTVSCLFFSNHSGYRPLNSQVRYFYGETGTFIKSSCLRSVLN
jgi:hypothetical protein